MENLKVCERCGARANARQIREMVDCDIPMAAAIDLVDQWVAFFGVCSSVLTMTRSTSASMVFRGDAEPRVVTQAVQTPLDEAPPPGADGVRRDPQPARHLLMGNDGRPWSRVRHP
ncbi:hypothetical protein [Streptomyces sp. NPDC005017]|uniref:hypothetical protein n=1 Tax=Streptomyces sp. NPDC005017 TaxID=3364706 RepID=UPI0036C99A4C